MPCLMTATAMLNLMHTNISIFIKFIYWLPWTGKKVWPLFNLADAFICVGVFLLTVEMMFFDEKKKPDEPAKVESAAPPAGPVAGPGPVVEGK